MSDSVTEKPPVPDISPVISQITGGNPAATAAATEGAGNAVTNFFKGVGQIVQDASQKIAAQVGINPSSNPQDIAAQAAKAGSTQANATIEAGAANAQLSVVQAQQANQKQQSIAADAIQLHLDPNSPEVAERNAVIAEQGRQATALGKELNELHTTSFWSDPGTFLVNHILKIPYAESQLAEIAKDSSNLQQITANETQRLQARTIADNASVVTDTIQTAALQARAIAAKAIADAQPAVMQGLSVGLGAWNLGVNQDHLAIARQMLPGQLAIQSKTLQWYDEQKEMSSLEKQARVDNFQDLIHERAVKQKIVADAADNINTASSFLGVKLDVTDPRTVPQAQREALQYIGENLKNGGSIGPSPAEGYMAYKNTKLSPDALITPGQKVTYSALDSTFQAELDKVRHDPLLGSRPPKEQEGIAMANMNKTIRGEQSNLTADNKFFPLYSPGAMLETPWGKVNPLVQELKGFITAPDGSPTNRKTDGSMLMNTAARMIVDKKFVPGGSWQDNVTAAARSLNDIGANTLNQANVSGSYQLFGIPVAKRAPVQYKSGWSTHTADLMDISDLSKQLTLRTGPAASTLQPFKLMPTKMNGGN
jgi:lambda repressor-like predicted transcriptional regulator